MTCRHTDVHQNVALSTTAQRWKQAGVHQQTHQQNVVYTTNGVLFSHKMNWSSDIYYNMGTLKNIILSEISQRQKDKYSKIHLHEMSIMFIEKNAYLYFT